MEEATKIAIFKGKKVRKTIYQNGWYFSVVDIIAALTDSEKPRDYWYRMKQREKQSSEVELSTLCRQLKLKAPPLSFPRKRESRSYDQQLLLLYLS